MFCRMTTRMRVKKLTQTYMNNARYYTSKFAAGMLYVGREVVRGPGIQTTSEEQWIGTPTQWAEAEKLESAI